MAEINESVGFRKHELKDVQLLNVVKFNTDTHKSETPKTIGYYREPNYTDYPLDLAKGCENFIFRDYPAQDSKPFNLVLRYLMQQENPLRFLDQIDFCSNRFSLIRILACFLSHKSKHFYKFENLDFEAVRFKGCIFLDLTQDFETDHTVRSTYAFKLRQHLFADAPGCTPNTELPINQSEQLYGTFSAKLGDLKLLYSGEISGVENTEPLGDLNDPKVLQQCRLAFVKVYRNNRWRTDYRVKHWLLQAHLSGIQQVRVGIFDDDGLVNTPIVGEGRNQLDYLHKFNMTEYTQYLRDLLNKITTIIGDADCPYTVYKFSLTGDSSLLFNGKKSERNSKLNEEFIKFANMKID